MFSVYWVFLKVQVTASKTPGERLYFCMLNAEVYWAGLQVCESSSVMISRTVSCSVKFCSYIISCLRCVASTLSDLSGNLQLLENQAKHSRPDQALQTLEERRTLQKCRGVSRDRERKRSWISGCVWEGFDRHQSMRECLRKNISWMGFWLNFSLRGDLDVCGFLFFYICIYLFIYFSSLSNRITFIDIWMAN